MKQTISETHIHYFPADRLVAYQVAKEVLAEVARLSARWPAHLRDQARRASESALLNVAEGASQPRGSGAKRRHFDIALASTAEVAAALDAAGVLRRSAPSELSAARQHVSRLGRLIAGLVRCSVSTRP